MNDIARQLNAVKSTLPAGVALVAVSKFHPVETLREAYDAGQRIFGESRVQELVAKEAALPKDIAWHFIGHLQTNKVKYIAPYIALIQAVDSYKLLAEINKQAAKYNRVIPCLLEIHIAREESKYGFTPQACREMLEAGEWKKLDHVRIAGVMGMATNTDDEEQIAHEFHTLKDLFDEWKQAFFAEEPTFKEVSMGMSHDYEIALRNGTTLVRVGTKIFGERVY